MNLRTLSFLGLILAAALAAPSAGQGPIRQRRAPQPARTAATHPLTGLLISMTPQSVELELADGERRVCGLSEATRYGTGPGDFAPGDRIAVDAEFTGDACTAAWVGRPEQRMSGERSRRLQIAPAIGEERSAILRQRQAEVDPFLFEALEVNRDFAAGLPNFICKQRIERMGSRDLGKKWKLRDVVEAEVLLTSEGEQYRNITIDGIPTGAKMTGIGGSWSTGEYATEFANLFDPATHIELTKPVVETFRGREAHIYELHVEQIHSRWLLNFNGDEYNPEYSGRIWFDGETHRGLKVEMEARNLPSNYPMITARSMVEFEQVEVAGESFLLPAAAEVGGCLRGTATCLEHRVAFADYHRFSSDASLFSTESTIEFGEEVPEPK